MKPLRILLLLCLSVAGLIPAAESAKPNVLFIAVDDLNDWVGPWGGHPQVKTPNLDRLARRGVVFTQAYCAAPLCNPSRAALFSGRHPFETGIFDNKDAGLRKLHPDLVLLPDHFRNAGYRTLGSGKLLHQKITGWFDEEFFPEQRWSPFSPKQVDYTPEELPSKGSDHPRHVTTLKGRATVLPFNRMPSDRTPDSPAAESFDWGAVDVADEEMGDGQIAAWGAERLRHPPAQPFFLALGFYRPHIPLYVPRKYFELYDGVELQLPPVRTNDLDDLGAAGRALALSPVDGGTHASVLKHDQWRAAVKAYLACVSFADAQIGKVLEALDASPAVSNTVIVVWGDNGWHLGEKQHWGKTTGWQRATRIPLLIVPPRNDARSFASGTSCHAPASLLDVYPTLIDLCGLPPRAGLSGQTLEPLLRQPAGGGDRVVLTTVQRDTYAVSADGWRYLRYPDGSAELYDLRNDPHEWTNLAGKPELRHRQEQLARHIPKSADGRFVDEAMTAGAKQYECMLAQLPDDGTLPRTFVDGKLQTVAPKDWTSGFFPGSLWYLYEYSRDPKWLAAATDYTERLASIKDYRGSHDVGFILNCSYGNGYRLTQNPAYRELMLQGAQSLASRYHPSVGLLRSWDHGKWSYPVIVDNLMNLEFMLWVARESKDPHLREIAISHADKTLQNHFRPDFSSYHVVDYNPTNGAVVRRATHQGARNDSAWARGQAWALYGYTMLFRETANPAYLAQATNIANFIRNHPRLPADKIPHWDFDAANIPEAPRDASAAAVMSSALIELSGLVDGEPGRNYFELARRQLISLSSPAYRAKLGENGNFILMHSVGNLPANIEVDAPLNYADYYYLEALLRYRARINPRHAGELIPSATSKGAVTNHSLDHICRRPFHAHFLSDMTGGHFCTILFADVTCFFAAQILPGFLPAMLGFNPVPPLLAHSRRIQVVNSDSLRPSHGIK
jgi:arylsulfatase A-like enzyme